MQKIYLTWSNWYFWSHIKNFFKGKYVITPSTVDIRNRSDLEKEINDCNPDIIINAAWKTWKPNVDWCESNKEETSSVNIAWAINLSSLASEKWIYFVHMWSWCIYEGDNFWKWFSEEDDANFDWSFYSKTKTLSEKALREFAWLQLRIRIPIETHSSPKNVIDKLVKYDKIISVENSFTVVEDFLVAMDKMIDDRMQWVYNMTNIWSCDHEFIMSKYKEIVDPNFNFEIMSLKQLDSITCAKRSNTVLNTDKRETQGYGMGDIKGRITWIMERYKANLS